MLTQLLLLSLLSALVTLSVARHGLGVLTRDPGRARNRAYFGLCLALALWSFAATMLPSAPDDRVWLWFRISLAGRTLAPCLLLHLALLVTARPSAPARRRLHAALYLPGIWFFAAGARAPESIGVAGFERSDWGWATVSGGLSAASGAYLVFFAGFVCAALAVVFRWGRRVELLSKRAQARRVVWTGLSTLALVLASGFALPWLGIRAAPEIPHVFAIVWVLALRRLAAGDDSLLASPSAVAEDILRTIADAVLLLDRGRRVVKVNQAGERLLGVEEAAAAGAQLSAVVGAEPAAAILELVEAGERHWIVRTAWLYNTFGRNFPKTMISLSTRDELKVVSDQYGSPTFAPHLAAAMAELIESDAYGVYHFAGQGATSWFELTQVLFRKLGIGVKVYPVATTDFPRPAERPRYSALTTIQSPRIVLPPWEEGLDVFTRAVKSGAVTVP